MMSSSIMHQPVQPCDFSLAHSYGSCRLLAVRSAMLALMGYQALSFSNRLLYETFILSLLLFCCCKSWLHLRYC
jgi:hypothetical protein